LVVLLVEGANALILIHGDPSYAETAAQAAKRLVSNDALGSERFPKGQHHALMVYAARTSVR
jgi:hypothetical protein